MHIAAKASLTVFGSIAAVVAVVNGVGPAVTAVEPWIYATRGYVREHVQTEINKTRLAFETTRIGVFDIQLSMQKTRRAQINDRLITEEIAMEKITDPGERIKKRYQIQQLETEGREADEMIQVLTRSRGP